MGRARVTMGLPVCNGGARLGEALESVCAQSMGDWTLLIADNASTDDTEHVARSFADRDARITYLRRSENIGAAPNFNDVYRRGRGDCPLFKWVAHDDVMDPEFLARTVERVEREPELVICHARTRAINERSVEFYKDTRQHELVADRPSKRLDALLRIDYPTPVWGVMRVSAIERTRLFGSYLGSDWNFMAEMLLQGPLAIVDEELFSLRDHEAGFSFGFQKNPKRVRLAWFDPRARGKGAQSAITSNTQLVSAVMRHPMPAGERARCLVAVGSRVGRKVSHKLGRLRPSAPQDAPQGQEASA